MVKSSPYGRSQAELDAVVDYTFQIQMRAGTTEMAVFLQCDNMFNAHKPLCAEDRLLNPDIQFPVSIAFGDQDWMDTRGSAHVVKSNKNFESGSCNLYELKDCGHMMPLMQPESLAKLLIDDIYGNAKHVW